MSEEFSVDFLELVKQKGVNSYEYMDSFERFFEKKYLVNINFFSSLKDEYVSKKDCLKAVDIWIYVFKMSPMGDYHDLCLKKDVLLLADVFEKIINACLGYYKFDPCHYPG